MGASGRTAKHLSVAMLLAAPSQAMAANYIFTNIADTTGPYSVIGSPPSLNNNGVAAFKAFLDGGGEGIYAGSGGKVLTIADVSGSFASLGSEPSINDSGVVAFNAELDNGGAGVFVGGAATLTPIADRTGPLNGFIYTAINNSGTVAFQATGDIAVSQSGIFTGNGGPITTIADNSGPFNRFGGGGFGRPDINASGTVAIRAVLDSGAHGIYSGSGGPVATIADISGVFSSLSHDPSINAGGTIAFSGRLDAGPSGIFTVTNGVAATVVDDSGPFANFNFIPGINVAGLVAFRATLDAGGEGLFIGPDPVADKVIQTGDALFGSFLTSPIIFERGLNDNGDVVFRYVLANGVAGIAVGRLIPEPASLVLLLIGVAVGTQLRRRRFESRLAPLNTLALICPLVAAFALPAAAANYKFINIVDNTGPRVACAISRGVRHEAT
jgi:hypothetical protein